MSRFYLLGLCSVVSLAWVTGCVGPQKATYEADPQLLQLRPLVVYQGTTGPMSQRFSAPQPGDAKTPPVEVQGEDCQSGLTLLYLAFGWGEGGYEKAYARAQSNAHGKDLYDVRADLHRTQVLGIWQQDCTCITASVR